MQFDVSNDENDSKSNVLLDSVKDQFPEGEFDALFKETENHLIRSFNINEVANRLFIINSNLYKTYLYYAQHVNIQNYLEILLDKKYKINTVSISKSTTNSMIEEGIEEGLRNNIIDFEI